MRRALGIVALAACAAPALAQDKPAAEATPLWQKASAAKPTDWTAFRADSAPTSISAFSMLGIPSDQVANVENVRDFTVALKGMGSNSNGMGISVTPSRTSIDPIAMNLSTYAGHWIYRVIGSTNLGYATGKTTINSAEFTRQAVSVQTNYFFRRQDDPVLAVADRLNDPDCEVSAGLPGDTSSDTADEDNARKCRKDALAKLRWNRSQISASYATGWIRPDGGSAASQSLGWTAAMAGTYGFDYVGGPLEKNAAMYLTLRHSSGEPVLDTLTTPDIQRKSSTLAIFRFSSGSEILRALAEVSNARTSDITATQRAFKQAVGVDYRLAEGTWLNFRFGKQRTIDGSRNETTSLLSVSYSPTYLLK